MIRTDMHLEQALAGGESGGRGCGPGEGTGHQSRRSHATASWKVEPPTSRGRTVALGSITKGSGAGVSGKEQPHCGADFPPVVLN